MMIWQVNSNMWVAGTRGAAGQLSKDDRSNVGHMATPNWDTLMEAQSTELHGSFERESKGYKKTDSSHTSFSLSHSK